MFFIFSKLLYFLIQPVNWVIGLMLWSLFAKDRKRKRKTLIAAIVLSLFFTNHFILNQFLKWWEVETITADQITEPYDIGILLGGYSNMWVTPSHDRHNFSATANRFMNAYELYRSGKVKKLLLTGGSGDLLQEQRSEAADMHLFFQRIGVPDTDIIIEPDSKNTHENAVLTKDILAEKYPGARCLLITSAWHMRRSAGCFEKENIAFTPYSSDHLSEVDRWAPENTLIPDRSGFWIWELMIKEWVGYVVYAMKGYI